MTVQGYVDLARNSSCQCRNSVNYVSCLKTAVSIVFSDRDSNKRMKMLVILLCIRHQDGTETAIYELVVKNLR